MANARPGYKRIMGEIPEEMHEKITRYNKISERPLNVSRAIELCMQQAVKKIDNELLEEASRDESRCDKISSKIYAKIKTDLDEDELNGIGIYDHYLKLVKQEVMPDYETVKTMLYPIDTVKYAGTKDEPCIPIVFYARGIHCFTLFPGDTP